MSHSNSKLNGLRHCEQCRRRTKTMQKRTQATRKMSKSKSHFVQCSRVNAKHGDNWRRVMENVRKSLINNFPILGWLLVVVVVAYYITLVRSIDCMPHAGLKKKIVAFISLFFSFVFEWWSWTRRVRQCTKRNKNQRENSVCRLNFNGFMDALKYLY